MRNLALDEGMKIFVKAINSEHQKIAVTSRPSKTASQTKSDDQARYEEEHLSAAAFFKDEIEPRL